MTKPKLGLLDKPRVLEAMLTGRYAVETAYGKFVGVYANNLEAMTAALDHDTMKMVVIPPIPENERATALQGCLNGVAKRKAEGRGIPPETLVLLDSLTVKA